MCGVALMWFIQMYLAMGYFRTENDDNLLATVDNTIRILQEAGGSAAPGDEETEMCIRDRLHCRQPLRVRYPLADGGRGTGRRPNRK